MCARISPHGRKLSDVGGSRAAPLLSAGRFAKNRRMNCTIETVGIAGSKGHVIRGVMIKPVTATPSTPLPAVLAYSDIFQLTGPHFRICQRLAGYGFAVV